MQKLKSGLEAIASRFHSLPIPIKAIVFDGVTVIVGFATVDMLTFAEDQNKYIAAGLGVVAGVLTWWVTQLPVKN